MDLYYMDISIPCRSVLLTAKAIGVELNKKILNVFEKEQLKDEFLNINFQHVIPTLVDGDHKLWESRVICTYLVSKYGKDDSLYPKCPTQRSLVDRMLYFECAFLIALGDYVHPFVILGQAPDHSKLEGLEKYFEDFNKFLKGHDYAVGNSVTVADHSLVATVSSIEVMGIIDLKKYPNVVAWLERCKVSLPGYESECGKGAKICGELVKSKLEALKNV